MNSRITPIDWKTLMKIFEAFVIFSSTLPALFVSRFQRSKNVMRVNL